MAHIEFDRARILRGTLSLMHNVLALSENTTPEEGLNMTTSIANGYRILCGIKRYKIRDPLLRRWIVEFAGHETIERNDDDTMTIDLGFEPTAYEVRVMTSIVQNGDYPKVSQVLVENTSITIGARTEV